ncbi:AAA family ATPase [Streptomyces sp. NPDC004647]|uniref:AAA family ATPase n=1 Tax=Streptomyces sp. NPDC004647 TaxID=3154671 RepID=UPI0033BA6D98
MQILGWRSEGLRCPDHKVNFRSQTGTLHSTSLVQMPNGTGKTTTLELLRAALSGSAADDSWDRDRVRGYRKREGRLSHGSFEVRLQLNEQLVTITLILDFDNGRASYKTTHGKGQSEGFHPPREFQRFLTETFVKFFAFDGELAQDLLDPRQVRAESVVENLFQINSLPAISRKVSEYWDNHASKVKATEEKALSQRRNRLAKLREQLSSLKEERKQLRDERSKLSAQLSEREEIYDRETKKGEAHGQRVMRLESRCEDLSRKAGEEATELLDAMRNPQSLSPFFAQKLYDLKTGLDRVKLPESAAREFFEELADELECICGRPIDEEIRSVIQRRSHQYLGSEDVSLLNSMKSSIHEAVGESRTAPEANLRERISDLDVAVGEERDAQNELDQLRLEVEQSDPAVKEAKEEIERLRARISVIDQRLERFTSTSEDERDDRTFGIKVIERRIREAELRLAEITETRDLREKRDILTGIINSAYAKAREGILAEVRDDANRRINELLPRNRITIAEINRCLKLKDQAAGSMGETLSVAYAFLATLFDRSDHQLPFVVDSPAGSIDLDVRRRIGELIPLLTRQFIAFTISSERPGFVQSLKQASSDEVQFLTIFRKGSEGYDDQARGISGTVESSDGFVVSEESFFNKFQLESQEV